MRSYRDKIGVNRGNSLTILLFKSKIKQIFDFLRWLLERKLKRQSFFFFTFKMENWEKSPFFSYAKWKIKKNFPFHI